MRIKLPSILPGLFSGSFFAVFRRHKRLLTVVVFSFFFGFTVYMVSSRFFLIKKIVVRNDRVRVLVNEQAINRHLLFFPVAAYREKILEDNPGFVDVAIRKRFPDTLELEFVFRKEAAVVIFKSGNAVVDGGGTVLGAAEEYNVPLPVIDTGAEAVTNGQVCRDPGVASALEFIDKAGDFFPVKRITGEEGETLRVQTGETDILITRNTDMTAAVSTLQMLLARFRMKGRMPVLFDLRFEKPVIRY